MPTSVAVMQVLRFYCNYVGGTFCNTYKVDLFFAIMQMTVSVAIMQLKVSVAFMFMQVQVSAANMSVVAMYVAVSSSHFTFLSLTYTHFS